jgi:hypothetical protein
MPGALVPAGLLLLITVAQFGFDRGLAASALFVLSLLAHEAGHVTVAQLSGKRVTAVGFCFRGAYNRREAAEGATEFAISAAGPAVNLAIAAALNLQPGIAGWLGQLNLIVALFNLLPFGGSDGQRMVRKSAVGVPRLSLVSLDYPNQQLAINRIAPRKLQRGVQTACVWRVYLPKCGTSAMLRVSCHEQTVPRGHDAPARRFAWFSSAAVVLEPRLRRHRCSGFSRFLYRCAGALSRSV